MSNQFLLWNLWLWLYGDFLLDLDVLELIEPPFLVLRTIDDLERVEFELLCSHIQLVLFLSGFEEGGLKLVDSGRQPPVEVSRVVLKVQVGVVVSEDAAEDGRDDVIHLCGPLEEELDVGPQQAQLDAVRQLALAPREQLHRVLDHLAELPDYLNRAAPRHFFLRVLHQAIKDLRKHGKVFGIKAQIVANQGKDVVTERGTGTFLNGFDDGLDDEARLSFIASQESTAESCHSLCTNVFVVEVLSELVDNICLVVLADKLLQDAHLGHLEVRGVAARKQKPLEDSAEDLFPCAHHQVLNVLQHHIFQLWQVVVEEREQAFSQSCERLLGNCRFQLGHLEEDLADSEGNCGRRALEPGLQGGKYVDDLLVVFGIVKLQVLKHNRKLEVSKTGQIGKQIGPQLLAHGDSFFLYLVDGLKHGADQTHIRLPDHLVEAVEDALVANGSFESAILFNDQFCQAHHAPLLDEGGVVVEALEEEGVGVLLPPLEAQVSEVPDSEGTDVGVRGGAVLDEGVDGHAGEVFVRRTVNAQVVIDQLLLHEVLGRRGQHQLGVEARGIYTGSGVGHNLLDKFLAVVLFFGIRDDSLEVVLDVVEFVLLAALEVDFLAGLLLARLLRVEVEVLNGEHGEYGIQLDRRWDVIRWWVGYNQLVISDGTLCPTQDKLTSFFGGLTGGVELDIKFDPRQPQRYHKVRNGKERVKLPAYFKNDDISGTVAVSLKDTKKYEHLGIKCYLIGFLEIYSNKDLSTEFTSLSKELEPAGILTENKTYKFKFPNFEKEYETFSGVAGRVRYFIRVVVAKNYKFSTTKEEDFAVLLPDESVERDTEVVPMKMEVGIEDCLHIDFEYNKSFYHLRDTIVGKVNFHLVKIKMKSMEIALVRKETFGTGTTTKTETETLVKYEVMDGCPDKGESIPIRMFMKGVQLAPSYKNIHNRLSVKYWINLVLLDEEDRKYFKQTEITIYRKP